MDFKYILIFIMAVLFVNPASAAWWNSSWNTSTSTAIPNGYRPYQLELNVSNSVGTNNATHIFCNGKCNVGLTDIRFTLANTTELPYWIENATTGRVWVNLTANGTVNMYYGNPTTTTTSNGTNTFTFFDDFSGTLSKWSYNTAKASIVNGEAQLSGGASAWSAGIRSLTTYNRPFIFSWTQRVDSTSFSSWNGWFYNNTANPAIWMGAGLETDFNTHLLREESNGTTKNIGPFNAQQSRISMSILPLPSGWNATYVSTYPNGTDNQTMYVVNTSMGGDGWWLNFQAFTLSGTRYQYIDNVRVGTYAAVVPQWAVWTAAYSTAQAPTSLTFTSSTLKHFNWTWTAGQYTNSYNVSHNGTWTNGSTNIYFNTTAINWSNITVRGYNTTHGIGAPASSPNIQIISPLNLSTITTPVPPYSAQFTWVNYSITANYYNFLLSIHTDFSDEISNQEVTTNTSSASLFLMTTYYWKVRTKTGSTYGEWSPTFNFILSQSSSPSSDNSTGVQGIVYQSTTTTPLAEARVTVYNTTWSSTTVTDSSGYYLFTGLVNDTVYNIKATKPNYVDSNVEIFTAINTTWYLKNIYLEPCRSGFTCFYDQQFVKFSVLNPLGTVYSGVTITFYKGDETTATDTKTTDSMGTASIILIKDQLYRITFISTTHNINEEITLYAKEDTFTLYVWGSDLVSRDDNITWSLTSTTFNATHTYLNLTYTSDTATTIGHFWVRDENGTALYTESNTTFTSWSTGYAVNSSSGLAYTWGFNATHPNWGYIDPSKQIRFREGFLVDLKIGDTRLYTWFGVIFLIGTAMLFGKNTNKYGYVLLPLIAMLFWAIGWYPQGYQVTHLGIIVLVLILGILMASRKTEKRQVYGE